MTDKEAPDRDSRPWLNPDGEPSNPKQRSPGPANLNPAEKPSELPEDLTMPPGSHPGSTDPGADGELTDEARRDAMKPRTSTDPSIR